jgi:uncharacterized membrane protein
MPPLDESPQQGEGGPDVAALTARVLALEQQIAELRTQMPAKPRVMAEVRMAPHVETADAAPSPAPRFAAVPRDAATLESDLGSKVLSKVAVLLLLAGAAFFLKWAYDNAWIGPTGRVLVGLVGGVAVILWSERFRRSGTPGFSYALKAVGSGVLYLSLWASFQMYHLAPAPVALLLMIAVTAWNAVMALTQDSRLLAGYALAGAYMTPVLLSTGGNHEVFLLLYLASIAAGVVTLLRFRAWNILLLAPVPVTSVFFAAWFWQHFDRDVTGLTIGLIAVLWVVFAAVPLVAREADDALAGVLHPLATAVFGALTVYAVLVVPAPGAEPWAAVAFAAAYLAMSRVRVGSVVSAIHLSLALTFLTVAIPLKLTGHGITVAWLAESLAVFWMATLDTVERRARTALEWLGLAAMVLGTGGAFVHLTEFVQRPFFNRSFATALGALVVLAAAGWLFRDAAKTEGAPSVRRAIAPLAFLLFNCILLAAVNVQLAAAFHGEAADFAVSAAIAVQGAAMLAFGFWRREGLARWTGLVLLGITLLKTVLYDIRGLSTGFRVVSYLALGVLLLAVSYAYQKDLLGLREVAGEERVS